MLSLSKNSQILFVLAHCLARHQEYRNSHEIHDFGLSFQIIFAA